jgi:DNA-binding MarR family transcriptional regulator
MDSDTTTRTAVESRLGYMLKHAHHRYQQLAATALEPFGIDGKQWAVLVTLGSGEQLSQQEAADVLGIDRTTMVALVDELEDKGLARRSRHPEDRRKNLVELTGEGRRTLERAQKEVAAAEHTFFAPLTEPDVDSFKTALRALVRGGEKRERE